MFPFLGDAHQLAAGRDFPRRAVATIDALGREHAPVAAWPVQPTPGRFETEDTAFGR